MEKNNLSWDLDFFQIKIGDCIGKTTPLKSLKFELSGFWRYIYSWPTSCFQPYGFYGFLRKYTILQVILGRYKFECNPYCHISWDVHNSGSSFIRWYTSEPQHHSLDYELWLLWLGTTRKCSPELWRNTRKPYFNQSGWTILIHQSRFSLNQADFPYDSLFWSDVTVMETATAEGKVQKFTSIVLFARKTRHHLSYVSSLSGTCNSNLDQQVRNSISRLVRQIFEAWWWKRRTTPKTNTHRQG